MTDEEFDAALAELLESGGREPEAGSGEAGSGEDEVVIVTGRSRTWTAVCATVTVEGRSSSQLLAANFPFC